MDPQELRDKAARFLELHTGPGLLILPCAWDAVSAKLFEVEGFRAIGTTSAGISSSLGYPDGQNMSLIENVMVLQRIVRCTVLPVSADVEAGYAISPKGVARCTSAVLAAGAAGMNLEDGSGDASHPFLDISLMEERIRAARETAASLGVHVVLNLRTDVFLHPARRRSSRLKEAVERGNAYARAGADCVFVPDTGDLDRETIAALVNELEAPLNVIAGANTPPVAELEALGVRRLSLGPRPMRAALAFLRKLARELIDEGSYGWMVGDALSYEEVNGWFRPAPRAGSPHDRTA